MLAAIKVIFHTAATSKKALIKTEHCRRYLSIRLNITASRNGLRRLTVASFKSQISYDFITAAVPA